MGSLFPSGSGNNSDGTLSHGAVGVQTVILSGVLLGTNRPQPVKVSCEYPKQMPHR